MKKFVHEKGVDTVHYIETQSSLIAARLLQLLNRGSTAFMRPFIRRQKSIIHGIHRP